MTLLELFGYVALGVFVSGLVAYGLARGGYEGRGSGLLAVVCGLVWPVTVVVALFTGIVLAWLHYGPLMQATKGDRMTMTQERVGEIGGRHGCPAWASVDGARFQCRGMFDHDEGELPQPHFADADGVHLEWVGSSPDDGEQF